MIWGKKFDTKQIWPKADALLGFNEPNHKAQSNLTPEAAAAIWPSIQAAAKAQGAGLLGSPAAAPCGNAAKCLGDTDDWFTRFFSACKNCTVDFLATHSYVCSADKLEAFLSGLHAKYNRPIWLTEFNCGDGANNRTGNST